MKSKLLIGLCIALLACLPLSIAQPADLFETLTARINIDTSVSVTFEYVVQETFSATISLQNKPEATIHYQDQQLSPTQSTIFSQGETISVSYQEPVGKTVSIAPHVLVNGKRHSQQLDYTYQVRSSKPVISVVPGPNQGQQWIGTNNYPPSLFFSLNLHDHRFSIERQVQTINDKPVMIVSATNEGEAATNVSIQTTLDSNDVELNVSAEGGLYTWSETIETFESGQTVEFHAEILNENPSSSLVIYETQVYVQGVLVNQLPKQIVLTEYAQAPIQAIEQPVEEVKQEDSSQGIVWIIVLAILLFMIPYGYYKKRKQQ